MTPRRRYLEARNTTKESPKKRVDTKVNPPKDLPNLQQIKLTTPEKQAEDEKRTDRSKIRLTKVEERAAHLKDNKKIHLPHNY